MAGSTVFFSMWNLSTYLLIILFALLSLHTAVVIGTNYNYFVGHDTDVGYKNYDMKYDFWIENYKIGPIIATELIL